MVRPFPLITFIRQFIKLSNNPWKVLLTKIANGIPCLFVFMWPHVGLENQIGNQPLSWFSQFFFWLWRCDFYLVQTIKFQQDVQGDILLATLDLVVFPNIATITMFHVNSWEKFTHLWTFPPRTSSKWINHRRQANRADTGQEWESSTVSH